MSLKQEESELFRGYVTRALPRARILKDTDDWPIVPGRNGRLEWRGPESDGEHRVYVHCRPTRVAAIPGVHRWQIGDNEATFWLRADDTKALQAVAKLLRLRYKRVLTPEQRQAAAARLGKASGFLRNPLSGTPGGRSSLADAPVKGQT